MRRIECRFCKAKYWTAELNSRKIYSKCCHNGKVSLPHLQEAPVLLKNLLSQNNPEAINYRKHIREYNAALAFASMGANIKAPSGNGPYCFRIHGQIYHMVSPLYANTNTEPAYGYTYLIQQ